MHVIAGSLKQLGKRVCHVLLRIPVCVNHERNLYPQPRSCSLALSMHIWSLSLTSQGM